MKKNAAGWLFICICILFISCSKEEKSDMKVYYANVQGEMKSLPGTPAMDIYINNEKVFTMLSGGAFGYGGSMPVVADKPVTLAFKKQDTDILLIDTTFTIAEGQTANFIMAYSEDLGIKGFVQPRAVAPDSVSIQFINQLGEMYSPAGGVDLYICKADIFTGEIKDTTVIVPNFEKGKPMPVLTLPADDINNVSFMYVGLLKDRQTGEFLIHQAIGMNLFLILSDWLFYPGKFNIGIITDDGAGYIFTNLIDM